MISGISPAVSERATTFKRLGSEPFDLLIIGGGITGAGIARDAVLRGLKVALVEKTDFAAGTSSKSSKLVHGGLRYLEHGNFKLVFEGTNERALLMKVAPHLVRPLEFLVPVYKRDRPGLFVLDVGLWIYDGLSKFSSPKLHRTVRAGRIVKLEPALKREDLEGGLLYYDCATDDARMTLENVVDARALGAAIVNYARVSRLMLEGDRVVGAEISDTLDESAPPVLVQSRVVINATGPWSDSVRKMAGAPPILSASKGVHLVLDAARIRVNHAVVMKEKRRVVFVLPWGLDRTFIGTTDTFYEGKPEDVHTDRDDVAYLLGLANRYFPEAKLTPDDVLATWAGLRPLIKPSDDVATASDVSREHLIDSRPGIVTIAGGKLTTYRRMAAEVVEAAGPQLGDLKPSTTDERPLPGAVGVDGYPGVQRIDEELNKGGLVDAQVAKHLAGTYGARAQSVVNRVRQNAALGERLDPELPFILAQVDVAVDEEQALTLEDTLGRRLPLLLKSRDQGLTASTKVAQRMGEKLGWSASRVEAEIALYRGVVERSRKFRI
jgi:glycerol-3-phosphate dehydrogenase